MKKLRIVAVSYTNTLPFIYGIKNSGLLKNAELELEVPAICAEKLLNGKADIGLIPIAVLRKEKNYNVVTDYCLGAEGPVKTVLLLSQKKLEKIEEVYLDSHSQTSVGLIKVLSRFYWNKKFNWIKEEINSIVDFDKYESILAIGDKTFQLRKHYEYVYDLSEQWQMFTSLPFVFACWIGIGNIDKKFLQEFNQALKFGVKNIEIFSKTVQNDFLSNAELLNYLQKDMSYILDERKRNAMEQYFQLLNQL